MRNVSRTHRVALERLFDRINLDPKIQIKNIDTKNQLADILTKGNFTREEWQSSVVFVQYQPFQFYSLFWSDGRKITTRFRRRASHSEIATNDEPYCKGALEHIILDVRKPGKENLWKSKSFECESWKRGSNEATRYGQRPKNRIWLLSWTIYWKLFLGTLLKVGRWQSLLFFLKSGKLLNRWMIERSNPL